MKKNNNTDILRNSRASALSSLFLVFAGLLISAIPIPILHGMENAMENAEYREYQMAKEDSALQHALRESIKDEYKRQLNALAREVLREREIYLHDQQLEKFLQEILAKNRNQKAQKEQQSEEYQYNYDFYDARHAEQQQSQQFMPEDENCNYVEYQPPLPEKQQNLQQQGEEERRKKGKELSILQQEMRDRALELDCKKDKQNKRQQEIIVRQPDFTPDDLFDSFLFFSQQQRRFGQ